MNTQTRPHASNPNSCSSRYRRHSQRREDDDSFLDQFDDLVLNATHGDVHAIEAIAMALGESFRSFACTVLDDAGEAARLVDAFLQAVLDGRAGRFRPSRERALPWLDRAFCRMTYGRYRRSERERRAELR